MKTEKTSPKAGLFSSGGWTRTNDLRVMSPTSYRLLYSAMWSAKVWTFFETTKFFLRRPFFRSRHWCIGVKWKGLIYRYLREVL